MRKFVNIPMAVAALAALGLLAASSARADDAGRVKSMLARQQRLLQKLRPEGESLAVSIDHNRRAWEKLTPDEREKYRGEALAFAGMDPQEQEKLLNYYAQLVKMDHEQRQKYLQRAVWLKVVVESFTPQERQDLQKLTAEDRAARLLDRKAQLIRTGKLPPDRPSSQPASLPATEPASKPAE